MTSRLEETKIATRYARALFEGAKEHNLLEPIHEDLNAVMEIFRSVPALSSFLENPGIPGQEKRTFLQEQFEGKVSSWVYNLLCLMLENDRILFFHGVLERYEALLDELNQVAMAEVVTASELPPKLESKLCKALEKRFGLNEVHLEKRVDPGILGGALIKIQDQVIDGSFVGKLEALRKQVS